MTALQPTLQRVGGQEKSNHRVGFSAASAAATVLSLQGAEEAGGGRGRPGAKVRPRHGFRGRPWVFQTFRLQGPAAGAAHPPAGPARRPSLHHSLSSPRRWTLGPFSRNSESTSQVVFWFVRD